MNKIPGTEEEKFAQLRAYYVYMMMHPGKKLQFMGNEVGEETEWNESREVEFDLLKNARNKGLYALLCELNKLYTENPAFYEDEYEPGQFEWLHCEQDGRVLFVMKRNDKKGGYAAVLNFSDKAVEDFEFTAVKLPEEKDEEKSDAPDEKTKKAKKAPKIKDEKWELVADTSWKAYGGTKAKKVQKLNSKEGIIKTDIDAFEARIYKVTAK